MSCAAGLAARNRDPIPETLFEQLNKEVRSEVSQVLLPHQLQRLDQLAMQMRMRGGVMAMLSPEFVRELGVTDQQREQLRTKVEELDRDVQRKVAEIRRQAQEQVISLMTAEQQAKLRDLIGELFEFENQPPPHAHRAVKCPANRPGKTKSPGGCHGH